MYYENTYILLFLLYVYVEVNAFAFQPILRFYKLKGTGDNIIVDFTPSITCIDLRFMARNDAVGRVTH